MAAKNTVTKITSSLCMAGVLLCSQMPVFCNAFDEAVTGINALSQNLQNVAKALFPLAIIITVIAMIITRDPKKFDMEKHILIGICVAYAIMIIATKGTLLPDTISGLFNGGSGGSNNAYANPLATMHS